MTLRVLRTSLISELLQSYQNIRCRISLKIHFQHSHLEFFPDNLGVVSVEQGLCFHEDVRTIETSYQGRWDLAMMADFVGS